MKITVNKELCAGCELCVSVCEDKVFEMVDGKSEVKVDAPLTDQKYIDLAKQAVEMCPSQAISIETEEPK